MGCGPNWGGFSAPMNTRSPAPVSNRLEPTLAPSAPAPQGGMPNAGRPDVLSSTADVVERLGARVSSALVRLRTSLMTVDREQLQAAGGEGFEVLLHSLRLDQRRRAGKLACKFCRQQLDLEEIAAVFPESGDVKVVCG